MKAYKYRLGNIVTINGVVTKLTPKHFKSLDTFKQVSPIRLTEQWLIDFGFENENTVEYPNYRKGIYKCLWRNGKTKICNNHGFVKDLTYVNELQNLYFFLTDKELKTKNN